MGFDPNIVAGDVICSVYNGKYHVSKVLVVDAEFETYHIQSFRAVDAMPTLEQLTDLDVLAMHAPVGAFTNGEKIGNVPITEADLQGYYYFLKTTNFQRYCEATGQTMDDVLAHANASFKEAYALTDEQRYDEAITKYLEAVDTFPQFYEAIDNMAFVKMNMGRWQDAIEDFRWSLSIQPDSVLAIFSIGECYLKMGHLEEAKEQFQHCLALDPENKLAQEFLTKVGGSATEKATADSTPIQETPQEVEVAQPEEASSQPAKGLEDYLNTPDPEEEQATPPAPTKKKWWQLGKK